ncbi:hypothetical protein EYF80_034401 [Liparis tanakae]|uniref:Uncharacterized protein n=1 Tax=Liparis tanakae TaxID=230148 RepID=A0A4Z2GPV2_9TELE|nr:hypothetical protein EYF80_034401 [Liparis tanakae]
MQLKPTCSSKTRLERAESQSSGLSSGPPPHAESYAAAYEVASEAADQVLELDYAEGGGDISVKRRRRRRRMTQCTFQDANQISSSLDCQTSAVPKLRLHRGTALSHTFRSYPN